MSQVRRTIITFCAIVGTSLIGGAGGYYVYKARSAYVEKKKRERKRAYRGSSTMRRDAGKRVGKAVDAWKDQFKK
ncbi:MAG: hypothetical protein CBC42_04215 [Betaproteobacteria bacterium TMED82]|nr:MAG: hypothetical protein CBC42_04215 [Betaproteobacteria bacterium TMED82]|tara:strand:- start:5075 stop:5299 length:225 start_codon:yes stop_codon:yes gene_type:complete